MGYLLICVLKYIEIWKIDSTGRDRTDITTTALVARLGECDLSVITYLPPIAWAKPMKNGMHKPIAIGVPTAVDAPI